MSEQAIDVILVGASGYGGCYLLPLLQAEPERVRLAALVDPYPERCDRLDEVRKRGIPFFPTLDEALSARRCDLAVISTPIHFHASQTCAALRHGAHVLCEKPLCASLEEIARMEAAQKDSGRFVSVGYQWSFSPAIQRLKADILAGRLGAPKRMRTLVCWPRDEAYYRRNRWAGKRWAETGEPVFDSPVNNAMAHFVHNMLYVLGAQVDASARVGRVEASLWRANPIENYDTASLRLEIGGGVEAFFHGAHPVEFEVGPRFRYEFEEAVVDYGSRGEGIVATLADGTEIDYGDPERDPLAKLGAALEAARRNLPTVCGIRAAGEQVRCAALIQAAAPIRDFPEGSVVIEAGGESPRRYVPGLVEALTRCHEESRLFSGEEALHTVS